MTKTVVAGRAALAFLLRRLADFIDSGALTHPFSIQPAPHLGPSTVRVQVDLDMGELLGVIPDPADDENET